MASRILVVDADRAAQEGLVRVLGSAGYQVRGASTLGAARQLLRADPPDLLIAEMPHGAARGPHLLLRQRVGDEALLAAVVAALTPEAPDQPLDFPLATRVQALNLNELLTVIARLVGPASPALTRRWPRRQVPGPLAQVEGTMASLVDVSYGGLGFTMPSSRAGALPDTFQVHLPAYGITIRARQVWKRRSKLASTVACGAALAEPDPDRERLWRGLVDGAF